MGDKPAQGGQTAGEPLYALDVAYRVHVGDGSDFFRIGFDVALRHDVSEQLPLQNPKNTFLGFNLTLNLWRFVNVAAKFAIRSLA